MTGHFDYALFQSSVRRARADCGYSYRQLAEVVNISFSSLHRICTKPEYAVECETFARLCEWMRVEPREFFYSDTGKVELP